MQSIRLARGGTGINTACKRTFAMCKSRYYLVQTSRQYD
jgi:hypothetical protein